MTKVIIDWAELTDLDAFFDSVFRQTQAPAWHGRNLNAINDSWVTGSICEGGPPFEFVFKHEDQAKGALSQITSTIREIAEDSIRENGGAIST